jgi:hypothetical protein
MSDPERVTGQQTPKWRYAVDHLSRHETRHEAIGAAAVINGYRDRIAPETGSRVTVWSYAVCDCKQGQTDLSSAQLCQRCGGAL